MFNKVKLKLTMVNIIVVSLIFFITVTGIYHLMQRELAKQTEQLMQAIVDAKADNINQVLEQKMSQNKLFYVKTQLGKIISTSSDMPISSNQLSKLVQKALASDQSQGKVRIQDHNFYVFSKKPFDAKNQIYLIVFIDTKPGEDILRRLFGVLVVALLSGLTLAFFGSLFMAERALIPIKQAWKRQKNFVADASHELRTPLAVMQTNLELITGNPKDTIESQNKWLQNIIRENKRMAKLVDDLLLLARADSQQELLDMKKFMLDDALHKTLEPFEPLAKSQDIKFEHSLDSQVEFFGDENRIKQLIVILLDNALKYTQAGDKVSVDMKDMGSSINITVSDTGVGIAEEHLEKIFERFYRVEQARSRKNGSTGLGLSIAQWIVKEHSGTIKVESALGEGTTFTVNLPKK